MPRPLCPARMHGTTKRQVQTHFLESEKPVMKPLPASLFPSFEEGRLNVHRDSYVEVNEEPKGSGFAICVRHLRSTTTTLDDGEEATT